MGTGGNQVPVIHTIAGNIIGRDNKNGGHQLGIGHDISPTLNAVDRHAVAVDVRNLRETEEVSGTLQAKKTGGYSLNYQNPVRINNNFYTRQSISEFKETRTASALKARDYKDYTDYTDVITANKSIRRLTPVECEKLQGLEPGYTDIEFNGKPAPDSRRYKALGNGMAQPCADFVIRRIAEVVNSGV
jgi:DNA (cytosine-5)-methyltransferase 1